MYKKAFELSYKNKKVEIEIQDFVGDVRNINGTEDLFSLSYISDSKDKGQSILVTEADINFYADDYFNIDELKTVGETDIKVKYYEDDALLWSGFVIPDFFSTSVDIAPVVSMVATDRIGTLKEISNNAESNIPIQILASCLKQTGQDLPINLIADNNHFETPIQLERIEEIASYDVIRSFMVLFNCKITLYKNAWWVVNKKLLETGFINYKSYNSDGAGGSVTPFAQPILDIDLVDRDGQREIKPTASEISLFLEFGGSKKYPNNWNFEKLNKTAKLFDSWSNHAGFEQGWRDKRILFYVYDSGYYNAWFTDEDTDKISLWYRFYWYNNKISDNILDYPNLRSEFVKVPTDTGIIEISLNGSFTTRDGNPVLIMPIIHNKTTGKYYTYNRDGEIASAGNGSLNFDLSKIDFIHNPRTSTEDGFNFDDLTHEVVNINWDIKNKFNVSDFGSDTDKLESQIIFIGGVYLQGALDLGIDIFINSVQISFNDSQVTGKGLIFKIKQGGEKFSKSRETETILFSDKINQGVNGHFYNYKYDDTSIVDLPSEFALSSVRERADMFSKARDYYSLDGDFIVNPLAKYTCGLKSFVLVGGENRREDAGIIVEEIVSNTLNRTDFIYTYFDDGKDKVKSIGTASGGSSSSGGGGAVSSPQLWKVDEEGNIYTEYNAYSLKELSAFGIEEEESGGVIINVIDNLTSTSKTDPLSANMGRYLKTLIDNIEVGEGGQVIVDWEAITGKPTTFAPSAHTHIIGDVEGLQDALDGKASLYQLSEKEDAFTKNSAFNKNFGTGLNDVARGNHTHTFESLTSIPTTLSGYGITDGASKVHTHAISDVTDLETTLDLKANLASPTFTGVVTAPTFIGALTGNATTATTAVNQSGGTISATTGRFSGTLRLTKNTPSGTLYHSLAMEVYSADGSPVGIGFHRSGYSQVLLSHEGSGLMVRAGGILTGALAPMTASTFIGALSGNATTATTLQTARTIWGQSFNGEANVSGAMTGVTTISMTGALTTPDVLVGGVTTSDKSLKNFINTFNSMFELEGDVIRAKKSLYSDGEISAFGAGESGGSGGGSMNMMQDWSTSVETENYYLPAKLAVPFYDNTKSRLTTLESGSATTVNVSGAGDLLASVSKVGNNINFIKGNQSWGNLSGKPSTFAPSAHSHPISDITNLQTTLADKLDTTVFNTHNTDNVRHITGAERTKWDTVVTDFAGLEIGGRNLALNTQEQYKEVGSGVANKVLYPPYPVWDFEEYGLVPDDYITITYYWQVRSLTAEPISGNIYLRPSVRELGGAQSYGYFNTTVQSFSNSVTNGMTTISRKIGNAKRIISWMFRLDAPTNVELTLYNVKLEKGTIATDWTPAPEDQVSDWNTTDVNSFSFIKNKPTLLSQFTDNIGVATHIDNKTNPHSVTKAQVGLGNVDNTSDLLKPISTATQTALDLKLNKLTFDDLFEKVETSAGKWAVKVKYNLFSVGEISAFGLGEEGGGSGGGSMSMMQGWSTSVETENYYLPAKLAVPFYDDTRSRLTTLEGGSATTVNVSGTGDLLASVSKVDNNINFIKGNQSWNNLTGKPSTFAPSAHTHNASDINAGVLGIERIPTGTSSSTVALGNHLHTGVYEPVFTKNTAFNKKFGTTSGTVAQGDDSRINNGQTAYEWGNHATAGYALNSAFTTHNDDNIRHITEAERTKWDDAYGWGDFREFGLGLSGSNLLSDASNIQGSGLYSLGANALNRPEFIPSSNGSALISVYENSARRFQISGGGGDTNRMAFRHVSETNQGTWNEIYHTGNLTSLSQLTDNIGVATHIDNKANPHSVTKAQVGLGSVDNTADSAKNVLSASKLSTSRTIWGQSFDGTGNVSGLATIGNILVGNVLGNQIDRINGILYLQQASSNDLALVNGGGNVGIGTISPQYKLDVSGTGRFTGAVTAPKVTFGNGWTAEGVGAELQFKLNGVIQAKIVNGALVSTGEISAFY